MAANTQSNGMTTRRARLLAAICCVVCASCVTAQSLSVTTLRAEIKRRQLNQPYQHDLSSDLAWIREMPLLERVASDIVNLQARFIAVDGDGWSVPGVPARLYCLIGPASMRPMPMNAGAEPDTEAALRAELDRFITPYNRLLAEYYEAEYGWECSDEKTERGQSMP
jgi:hypothetical protein